MRILITGASGLVGKNVSEALAGGYDLLTPKRAELDLLDYSSVTRYMQRTQPELVIHCAGVVGGIHANIKEPVRFLVANMDIGRNAVLAARAAGVSRFLNLGSSCMYPRGISRPLREEDLFDGQLEPTNEGYAIAKIAVQRLCAYISREDPSRLYKTIIPCNLYGRWDSFDVFRSHLVPAALRKVFEAKARGDASVEVWGSGLARREFMYAGDLASFVAFAIPRFDLMPDPLNVGLGYDFSVDEYYQAAASVIGFEGTFEHAENKPEGMARKMLDVEKLTAFGWRAATTLQDGLGKTFRYFLDHVAGTT